MAAPGGPSPATARGEPAKGGADAAMMRLSAASVRGLGDKRKPFRHPQRVRMAIGLSLCSLPVVADAQAALEHLAVAEVFQRGAVASLAVNAPPLVERI